MSCWKSPIEQKPKSTWEAGAEPSPSALLPGLVKRNVYVGSFSRELNKNTPNKTTKQTASTEILEIAGRWWSASYFRGMPCSISVHTPVPLRHLTIFPSKTNQKDEDKKQKITTLEWWGGSISAMPCGAQPGTAALPDPSTTDEALIGCLYFFKHEFLRRTYVRKVCNNSP